MSPDTTPQGGDATEQAGWDALPIYPSAAAAVRAMKHFNVREGKDGFVEGERVRNQSDQYRFQVETDEGGKEYLISFLLCAVQGRLRLTVSERSKEGPTEFKAGIYPPLGRTLVPSPDQAGKLPVKFVGV